MLLLWLLAQADSAGTVKLISKSASVTEAVSGEAYVLILPDAPARFSVAGPAKVQVDFRVNLPKKKGNTKPVLVEVVADGSSLSKLRINAKIAKQSWKGREVSYKPSEPAEFFLDVGDGVHEIEFRMDAKLGGALYLVEASQATRPLAADAPGLTIAARAATPEPPALIAEPPAPVVTAPVAEPERPAPEVRTEVERPVAVPVVEAPHLLALTAMGGVTLQTERQAFARQGAGEILAQLEASLKYDLRVAGGYDARFGDVVVPLTADTAPATAEARHSGYIAFGWVPKLTTFHDWQLDLGARVFYRVTGHSNAIAPSLYGIAGVDVTLALSHGFAHLFLGGGVGPRLHDSTPPTVATGAFVGRAHWQVGARADIVSMFAVVVAYRGELLLRTGSFRQADGVHVGAVVSFL